MTIHQESVVPYGYCKVDNGKISEEFYNKYGYDECYGIR